MSSARNQQHARAASPEEAGLTPLAALLDRTWTDETLARLARDEQDFEAFAAVPRDIWETALLGPARDMLARPGKELRGQLVRLAWTFAGGRGACPEALVAAVEIIHAGSLIVDDIEDDSSRRRGEACLHRLHGVPVALNTGNWMYFWPLELVGTIGLPTETVAALRGHMSNTMFRCHFGQALDVSARVGRVAQTDLPGVVATMTALKTGSLLELAAALGAVAAGGEPTRVAALLRFGRRFGIGLQMLDDLGNLSPRRRSPDDKRHEDLRLGRATWPWAWLAELEPARFFPLEADARVLAAQVAAGRAPDTESLAATLRETVGVTGRLRAHARLGRALDELAPVVGRAAVDGLASEVARLESAYV